MNDDTISRQAAIDAMDNRIKQHLLENRFESFEEADSETKWFCDGIMESIGAVMDLPAAQPQRMRGKWIYNSPVTMKCDQCGIAIKDWDWHRFKFCPRCGADMREGEQNETD